MSNIHYVCTGGCGGVSDKPGVCQATGCSKFQKLLIDCDCLDGLHKKVFEYEDRIYKLPELKYGYGDLVPFVSEEQLMIHYKKHHQVYVNGANAIFEKLEKARLTESFGQARGENAEIDIKAISKELSFNVGGHVLHSIFWESLAPARNTNDIVVGGHVGKGGGGEPQGKLAELIKTDFGSFERFKKEFSQAAISVEGSGWAALVFDKNTGRLLIAQIEKHNTNLYPNMPILLVLDVFEHAYYLDYKNERAKFVEAFWNVVNWENVEKLLD